MGIFIYILLLLLGLFLLWKSGDYCVKYSVEFSLLYHFGSFAVGFFIFAISTGLPEISSAVISSLKKAPELSTGDLIGSTFFNLTMVLGVVILLSNKIEIKKILRKRIFLTTLTILAISVGLLFFAQGNIVIGILLILLYFVSIFFFKSPYQKKLYKEELKEARVDIKKLEKNAFISAKVDVCIKLLFSLVLLVLSSWLTVHSAIEVAHSWHLDLSTMGGTFMAIGTGLPELSLEIHAVRKKQYSLALGDIFGSSLLNVSFVLGLLICLNPALSLGFSKIIFPFMAALLLFLLVKIFWKFPFHKKDGYILSTFFLLFIFYILLIEIFSLRAAIEGIRLF